MCIIHASRYYDVQKIKQYQKLVLQYDYTTGILFNTNHVVYCIMPCSTILVEENGLMDLVIVCELIKIFPSKCTNKLICIYVCTVYMHACICAYMYVMYVRIHACVC